MEWEQIEGNWAEFKNIIRHHWDKLTDKQLDMIAGRREFLIRKIQYEYGFNRQEVEAQLAEWQENQINIDGHFYQTKSSLPVQFAR